MTTDTLNTISRSAASRRIAPWIFSLPLCFAACAVESGEVSDDIAPEAAALKHCAVDLHGETTCYPTFNEAISHATAGRITDASVGPDGVVDVAAFAERVTALGADRIANVAGGDTTTNANGTTMVGTVYKAAGFRTNEQTWTFYVPGTFFCDSDPNTSEFDVVNLNTSPYTVSHMNDQISSFISYYDCKTVLWTDWYFSGPATNDGVPVARMDYVGDAMNDKASSIAWF